MSLKRSTPPNERGASALMIAMTMVLIMGVAAVAIDAGLAFSERRQAQAAVDFGALAALQKATSCDPGPCDLNVAVDNGADEAILVVDSNLPGRFVAADWSNCTDPNRPAEFTEVSSFDCVSFTENLGKVRVVLPDDDLDTTFGRLLGVNTLTIGAFAEAGSTLNASSRILPFSPLGVPGNELCLFSNQAPQTVPPCEGSTSGFFGYLDLALYGTEEAGTPHTCNNGTTNTRIAINITRGSDHSLVIFDPGPPDPIVGDFDACPNIEENVNQVRVETGSPTGGITDGLINGVSGSINGQSFTAAPGRIVCDPLPTGYSTECANIRGESLDHTGLWEFLVPGTCPGPDPTTHDQMLACLSNPGKTARFTKFIADHPRFAAVPVLWPQAGETEAPTGPGDYEIKEFFAVWIETLYFDCNANKCDTVHSPGENFAGPGPGVPPPCPPVLDAIKNCDWSDTSGNDDVEGMLAFNIDLSMLPSAVTDFFPSITGQRDYALTR